MSVLIDLLMLEDCLNFLNLSLLFSYSGDLLVSFYVVFPLIPGALNIFFRVIFRGGDTMDNYRKQFEMWNWHQRATSKVNQEKLTSPQCLNFFLSDYLLKMDKCQNGCPHAGWQIAQGCPFVAESNNSNITPFKEDSAGWNPFYVPSWTQHYTSCLMSGSNHQPMGLRDVVPFEPLPSATRETYYPVQQNHNLHMSSSSSSTNEHHDIDFPVVDSSRSLIKRKTPHGRGDSSRSHDAGSSSELPIYHPLHRISNGIQYSQRDQRITYAQNRHQYYGDGSLSDMRRAPISNLADSHADSSSSRRFPHVHPVDSVGPTSNREQAPRSATGNLRGSNHSAIAPTNHWRILRSDSRGLGSDSSTTSGGRLPNDGHTDLSRHGLVSVRNVAARHNIFSTPSQSSRNSHGGVARDSVYHQRFVQGSNFHQTVGYPSSTPGDNMQLRPVPYISSRFSRALSSASDRTADRLSRTSIGRHPFSFPGADTNAHQRLLPEQGVLFLDRPYYGSADFIDRHRDMRLDIDNMTYEELLALEEHIGDVSTGVSEEAISKCLKLRIHTASEKGKEKVEEDGTCIICQEEYKNKDEIGALVCGHDYHIDCIKQWLLIKNVCPICKTVALEDGS